MNLDYRNVIWVFSTTTIMSSDLIGGIVPANYLNIKKLIFLANHNVNKTLDTLNPKIIIFSRCMNSNIILLAKEAKKRNIKIISIFDDWHFKSSKKREEIKFKFNENLAFLSDKIVVKTESAAKILYQNTKLFSKIIPDSIRYTNISPVNKFSNVPNLIWFGSSSNHDSLIQAINEINNEKIICNIKVVTNITDDLTNLLKKEKFDNIKIKLIEFSDKNLISAMKISEIIILPIIEDFRRIVKSTNRIVDSLNFGRFLISSDTYLNEEFSNFCYRGNIGQGIKWLYKNKIKSINMLSKGQKYVKQTYHIEKTSFKWKKLIEELIC